MEKPFYSLCVVWKNSQGITFSRNSGSLSKDIIEKKRKKCLEFFNSNNKLKMVSVEVKEGTLTSSAIYSKEELKNSGSKDNIQATMASHKVHIETSHKYVDPRKTLLKETIEANRRFEAWRNEDIGTLDFSDWD